MLIVFLLFGVPLILFTAQLLLSAMTKGLFFRLVPFILWTISLTTVVVLDILWRGAAPGIYLYFLLPRLLAIVLGWGIGHLIKKRKMKKD